MWEWLNNMLGQENPTDYEFGSNPLAPDTSSDGPAPLPAGTGNDLENVLSDNAGLLTGLGAATKVGNAYFANRQAKHMGTIAQAQKNIDKINIDEQYKDANRELMSQEADAEDALIKEAEDNRQKYAAARSSARAATAGTGASLEAIDDISRKDMAVKQNALDAMHRLGRDVDASKGKIGEAKLNADLRNSIRPNSPNSLLLDMLNVAPGSLSTAILSFYNMKNMVGSYEDYKFGDKK
jgi:hypothetical protein